MRERPQFFVRIVRGEHWVFDRDLQLVSPPDPAPHDPCDLVYYSPRWWDSLDTTARAAIVELATEHVRPDGEGRYKFGSGALRGSRLKLSKVSGVGAWWRG